MPVASCSTDCHRSIGLRARPKSGSQRGTGVTSVTQITYKCDVFLCRLQVNQSTVRTPCGECEQGFCACRGSSVVFCDHRDWADAGVVPWALYIDHLWIRLV